MKLTGHEEVSEIYTLSLYIDHMGFMVDIVVIDGCSSTRVV